MKMKLLRGRRGQTMVEYILIVALIAIAIIAAVKIFGKSVNKSYKAASEKVEDTVGTSYQRESSGSGGTTNTGQTNTSANQPATAPAGD